MNINKYFRMKYSIKLLALLFIVTFAVFLVSLSVYSSKRENIILTNPIQDKKVAETKELKVLDGEVYLGDELFITKGIDNLNLIDARFGPDTKTLHLLFTDEYGIRGVCLDPQDLNDSNLEKPYQLNKLIGGMFLCAEGTNITSYSKDGNYFVYLEEENGKKQIIFNSLHPTLQDKQIEIDAKTPAYIFETDNGTRYFYPDSIIENGSSIMILQFYKVIVAVDIEKLKFISALDFNNPPYQDIGIGVETLNVYSDRGNIFYVEGLGIEGGTQPYALVDFSQDKPVVTNLVNLQKPVYPLEVKHASWSDDGNLLLIFYNTVETLDPGNKDAKEAEKYYEEVNMHEMDYIILEQEKYEKKLLEMGYSRAKCEFGYGIGMGCHVLGNPVYYSYSTERGLRRI